MSGESRTQEFTSKPEAPKQTSTEVSNSFMTRWTKRIAAIPAILIQPPGIVAASIEIAMRGASLGFNAETAITAGLTGAAVASIVTRARTGKSIFYG